MSSKHTVKTSPDIWVLLLHYAAALAGNDYFSRGQSLFVLLALPEAQRVNILADKYDKPQLMQSQVTSSQSTACDVESDDFSKKLFVPR